MKRAGFVFALALAVVATGLSGAAWARQALRAGFRTSISVGHGRVFLDHGHVFHHHHPFRLHQHFFFHHRPFVHAPFGPFLHVQPVPSVGFSPGFWRWDGFRWVWVERGAR